MGKSLGFFGAMEKNRRRAALALLVFVGGLILSVGSQGQDQPNSWASVVRGGRLYDNWFEEIHERPPETVHPAYPAEGPRADDPATSWRCKECHGWDYKGKDGIYGTGDHATGIIGIDGMIGAPPETVVTVLKDANHGYGELMGPDDLADLAAFVSRGQLDMDRHIDRETGRAMGDSGIRAAEFQTICANCHGRDGLKVRDMPPLGEAARQSPWEALHNILNGHPNEKMPSLRILGIPTLVDILAYAQALPSEEILASVVRGGRLYDNWINATGRPSPETRHPAYPADRTFAKDPGTNWRCKECHGWDYRGKDGAYGRGEHFTGIKGIWAQDGINPDRVKAILADENHRYQGRLDVHDLRDLANFLTQGQVDMTAYIDPQTGRAKGDPDRSAELYGTVCTNCHGPDGRKVITTPPLGRTATTNPWETLHKILNGHPSEKMPALRVLDQATIADVIAYLQTFPTKR